VSPPFVNVVWPTGGSVSFISGSGATYEESTEVSTHSVTYTPSQTGLLVIGFAHNNTNTDLSGVPTGLTKHNTSDGYGSSYSGRLHVCSVEITSGMVGNLQSWDFVLTPFAKRATAVMFMLDGVDHASVAGGTYEDFTLTDRTSAGGGSVTVGTAGSAVIAFAAANNASSNMSVSSAASFTQVNLVNPATAFQPEVYGGYRIDPGTGSVTVPTFANTTSRGMGVFAMEVQAA